MSPSIGPTIAFFSSNSRAKYFDDCLQALMLPRGMVLHFRYRDNYLEPMIKNLVAQGSIVGQRVVVCYLYQEFNDQQKLVPQTAHALRAGRIVDARIDGTACHFYFEVEGYPTQDSGQRVSDAARAAQRRESDKYFVCTIEGLSPADFSAETSDSASFSFIAGGFPEDQLRYPDLTTHTMKHRDAFFYRVEGIYQRGSAGQAEILSPSSFAAFGIERGYVVQNDDPLEVRVQYEQPQWSNVGDLGLSLSFAVPESHFGNPPRTDVSIGSPYDRAEFYVVPLRDNHGWLSRMELQVDTPDGQSPDFTAVARTRFAPWVRANPVHSPKLIAFLDAFNNMTAIALAIVSGIIALIGQAAKGNQSPIALIPWWVFVIVAALLLTNVYAGVVKSGRKE